MVADRSVRLGSTTVLCVNDRLEVQAGNSAALSNQFPAYAWTEEQEALLRATDRLPALTLFKDGAEFMGFLFLFEKGKVTTEQREGLMAVSQGGAPKPLLFGGKLTPLTLNPAKPYTLHTSVTESSVWSNLHVDPAQGRVTVWSSRAPGKCEIIMHLSPLPLPDRPLPPELTPQLVELAAGLAPVLPPSAGVTFHLLPPALWPVVGEGSSRPPLLARAGSLSFVLAPGMGDIGSPLLLTDGPEGTGQRRRESGDCP